MKASSAKVLIRVSISFFLLILSVLSLDNLLHSGLVADDDLCHRPQKFRRKEIDSRALYLKFYRAGQIQILQELLLDLEEIVAGAEEEER